MIVDVKLDKEAHGDDVMDDTSAFVKALSELEVAGGGVLYVPAGSYRLAATVVIRVPIIVQGEGGNVSAPTRLRFAEGVDGILVQRPGAGTIIRDLQVSSTAVAHAFTKAWNPSINEGAALVGGAYAKAPIRGNGIVLQGRASIVDCYVAAFAYDGIHIESAGHGDAIDGFELHHCTIGTSGRHGLYVAGPGNRHGRVLGCAFDGNAGWSVYDATRSGNTYIACQTQAGGHFAAHIGALAVSQASSNVVWAGSDDGGVYRSATYGRDWTAYNDGLGEVANAARNRQIRALAVDPSLEGVDRPFVATADGGVLRLAGLTGGWSAPGGPATPESSVYSLALVSSPASRLYAGGESGVWVSTNEAATWSKQLATGTPVLGVAAANGTQSAVAATASTVYVTADAGASWTAKLSAVDPDFQGTRFTAVAAMDASTLVVATDLGALYRTTNGGASWSLMQKTTLPPKPVSALAFDTNLAALYAAVRDPKLGGVHRYVAGAWSEISHGFDAPGFGSRRLRAVAVDPTNRTLVGSRLYAGTDPFLDDMGIEKFEFAANPGGVYRTFDGGALWHGGKPWTPAVEDDPSSGDAETAFGTYYGGAYKTTNPQAAHTFVGCYVEGGNPSGNELAARTIVAGGNINRISPVAEGGIILTDGLNKIPVLGPVARGTRVVKPSSSEVISVAAAETMILVDASKYAPIISLPGNGGGALTGYEFTVKRTDEVKQDHVVIVQISEGVFEEDPTDIGKTKLRLVSGGASVTVVVDSKIDDKGQCRYRLVGRYGDVGYL